jgi:hypothetical protein
MYQLGNFCILLLLLPLLAALWVEGGIFLVSLPNPQALLGFFAGLVGMLLLCAVLRGSELHLAEGATHEMTHALVGWPFMGKPVSIEVKADSASPSGEIKWISANRPNFIVSIAPYSFPILAIPPLILKLLPFGQTPPASLAIDAVLGAALAFHYLSIWDAIRVSQPDLTNVSVTAGVAAALTFQLLFLVVGLSAVMGIPQLIGGYFRAVWVRMLDYYEFALGLLAQVWSAATGS